jgi:glycosyltransferase involved in cell wall biosynthesis
VKGIDGAIYNAFRKYESGETPSINRAGIESIDRKTLAAKLDTYCLKRSGLDVIMKHLLICPNFPYPPDSGASIRTFNLLKRLAQRHEIDLIAVNEGTVQGDHIDELKKYCTNVYLASLDKNLKILQWARVTGRLLKGEPFHTKYVASRELEKLIWKATRDQSYDIVQFEHSHMARHFKFVHPQQRAKSVLMMHNVASIQFYRMSGAERRVSNKIKYFLTWFPMLRWEPKIASKFHKIIVASEVDRIILKVLQPGLDISVVPNGIDSRMCQPCINGGQREKNILIVGSMDYAPNVDAVMYFYREIFPVIREKMPECTLTIVGRKIPDDIQRLKADAKVMVEANVKEVGPYYRKAIVSAVALRSGGGTRLKILESMAFGIPVVSTSIGCEGLEIKNGQDILIADTPAEFANRVLEVIRSPVLWDKISRNARKVVEEKYDWDQIAETLEGIYEELVRM